MKKNDGGNGMFKAYEIAGEMLRDRLKDTDKEAAGDFDSLGSNDVIVAKGSYDYIENVFRKINLPHQVVDPREIDRFSLDPKQIVFLNCPGNLSNAGVRNLVGFVENGGFLFTTDWALKHVIERGFAGTLRYNGNSTADEVVRVEINAKDDPFLQSLISEDDDPQWWLEGSSYPIEVLDPKVEVLVRSKEVKEKYGESAVFTSFDWGKGKVYHMISHFYLQRTETRSERHRRSSTGYVESKLKMSEKRMMKYASYKTDESSLGEVESAYSSSSLMGSVILEKSRRNRKKKSSDQEPQKYEPSKKGK